MSVLDAFIRAKHKYQLKVNCSAIVRCHSREKNTEECIQSPTSANSFPSSVLTYNKYWYHTKHI